jgi:hypothetical protein
MGLVVRIVAALTIVGVAALGLILAQKGSTPTATAVSTVYIASMTQEVSALPTRAPISQIAQATGSEASPLILQANVDANPAAQRRQSRWLRRRQRRDHTAVLSAHGREFQRTRQRHKRTRRTPLREGGVRACGCRTWRTWPGCAYTTQPQQRLSGSAHTAHTAKCALKVGSARICLCALKLAPARGSPLHPDEVRTVANRR